MDLKDRNHSEWERLYRSFVCAISGLIYAFKRERNLPIHFVFAVFVIALGAVFHITETEWIIITCLIGGMISFELMNTAVERVVDLITDQYHPLAKAAKDISAASVFIFAITAVITGFVIFAPYIIQMISS